ncbi:hypothetical protein B0H12DRAFT_1092995 [Mycena haematopus]|nr:hypothetical protein B0H12DRAFT_1092995 [Mycena haematopus]
MYIGLYPQDGCEARHRRQSSCDRRPRLASSDLALCKPTIFSISLILFDCL